MPQCCRWKCAPYLDIRGKATTIQPNCLKILLRHNLSVVMEIQVPVSICKSQGNPKWKAAVGLAVRQEPQVIPAVSRSASNEASRKCLEPIWTPSWGHLVHIWWHVPDGGFCTSAWVTVGAAELSQTGVYMVSQRPILDQSLFWQAWFTWAKLQLSEYL